MHSPEKEVRSRLGLRLFGACRAKPHAKPSKIKIAHLKPSGGGNPLGTMADNEGEGSVCEQDKRGKGRSKAAGLQRSGKHKKIAARIN